MAANRRERDETPPPPSHPAFNAKVALAALGVEKMLAELAQCDVHANQTTQCCSQLLEGAADVFGSEARSEASAPGSRRQEAARQNRVTDAGE